MKKFSMLIICLVLIFGVAFSQAKEKLYAQKNFDRFEDKTTIEIDATLFTKKTNSRTQPRICATISYPGQSRPKNLPAVNIILSSINEDWKYLNCHSTYCLVDGKPLELPKTEHYGDVMGGGKVIEIIYVSVPYSTFVKMCEARKIEFKICNTEFIISEFEKTCLKQVKALYESD